MASALALASASKSLRGFGFVSCSFVPMSGTKVYACKSVVWNLYRQEEQGEAGAGTGEDLCHPSGYNKETARAVSLMKYG